MAINTCFDKRRASRSKEFAVLVNNHEKSEADLTLKFLRSELIFISWRLSRKNRKPERRAVNWIKHLGRQVACLRPDQRR
jgi:hypothetical protein